MSASPPSLVIRSFLDRAEGLSHFLLRAGEAPRLLAFDDFFHDLRSDRLNVSAGGEFRIGHDRGRIGVHEDHLVAFLQQCLARLHAGIIKFTALTDDNRAGTNHENFGNGSVFGHGKIWGNNAEAGGIWRSPRRM